MTGQPLLGIDHIVAIASGKGGVGKTTITVRTALALRDIGLRVGIFDADVYGPNVPLMLGIHRRARSEAFVPVVRSSGAPAYIRPLERHGLKIMSVGLLLAEDQAINPPSTAAGQFVVQTLKDVLWGSLDVLLIDLPPSAGQPQEDLLKRVLVDGVVIVTTPQDLSLLDAGRSQAMFVDAGVDILGLVENMAYFQCPDCGQEHAVFARSAAWEAPLLQDLPVLGRIPLEADIGRPVVGVRAGDGRLSQPGTGQMAVASLAREVWQQLQGGPHRNGR